MRFNYSSRKVHLFVVFAVYIICAAVFGLAYRYAMNPDGISILRLSGYIAEGHFMQSVTRAWSPLLSWMIAPFLLLEFQGLAAARSAIAVSGAGLLFGSWMLSDRFDLSDNLKSGVMVIAAVLISFWTVQSISADVLVAALIVYYLYLLTSPDILNSKKVSFSCGLVSGFSYLAHHYALPFFMVHFPLMLLLRAYADRTAGEGLPLKKILISWVAGIAGVLIIVSMWVGVVSVKYGQFTISSKGPIAHAAMGPKDVDRRHPFFVGGLYKPKHAYASHVYEDPSDVKFKTWSPFESREYFVHQLGLIRDNAVYLFNHFVNMSPFFTYPFMIGVLTLITLAVLVNQVNGTSKYRCGWIIITFCVYCSGYLLIIAKSPRRFYALMIVFLLVSFHLLKKLQGFLENMVSGRRMKMLTAFIMVIASLAFVLKPCQHLVKSARHLITAEQINPYKDMAEQIKTISFPMPYAIVRSTQKLTTDYYLNYFMGGQLLGRPLSSDPEGLAGELVSAGAKSLLVFDNQELVRALKNDKKYNHVAGRKLRHHEAYRYAAGWIVEEFEIITGWADTINVFTLK